MKALDVVASTQPLFDLPGDKARPGGPQLGAGRAASVNAFRRFDDAGVVQAFGSGWPVFPATSSSAISAAATADRGPTGRRLRRCGISVEAALRHFTRDAAYAVREEDVKGVLKTGYLGDFTVLSEDILAIPPADHPEDAGPADRGGGQTTCTRAMKGPANDRVPRPHERPLRPSTAVRSGCVGRSASRPSPRPASPTATGAYDRDRYQELRSLAVEMAADGIGREPRSVLLGSFASGVGYPTPKIDVRAVVFRGDELLLVREAATGGWTLPGGWADVGDTPGEAAERETLEESGYRVKASEAPGAARQVASRPPARRWTTPTRRSSCARLGGRRGHDEPRDDRGRLLRPRGDPSARPGANGTESGRSRLPPSRRARPAHGLRLRMRTASSSDGRYRVAADASRRSDAWLTSEPLGRACRRPHRGVLWYRPGSGLALAARGARLVLAARNERGARRGGRRLPGPRRRGSSSCRPTSPTPKPAAVSWRRPSSTSVASTSS